MPRKVKCKITGEYGFDTDFFKIINDKGKNEYYKTEEIYNQYIKNKKDRENLLKFIADAILDYGEGQVLPTILLKKIKELNLFYPYEVIQETFKVKEKDLNYWMNKEDKFQTDYQKCSYMMAIIKNTINDIYKKWKCEQNVHKIENNTDINMLNDIDDTEVKKPINRGISDFLDD